MIPRTRLSYGLSVEENELLSLFPARTWPDLLKKLNQLIPIDCDFLWQFDPELTNSKSVGIVHEFPSPRQDVIEKYLAPVRAGKIPSGINPMRTHTDILGELADEDIFFDLMDAFTYLYTFMRHEYHKEENFRTFIIYLSSEMYVALFKHVNPAPCAFCAYLIRIGSPQTRCGHCGKPFEFQVNQLHLVTFPEDGFRHPVWVLTKNPHIP